jgi:hypothetical protein
VNIKVLGQRNKDELHQTFDVMFERYLDTLHHFKAWSNEPTKCPKLTANVTSGDDKNQWLIVKVEQNQGFGLYYPAKNFNLSHDFFTDHDYNVIDIIDCVPPGEIEDLNQRASKLKL